MLKAWDTLVGEARCLFTASVEGGDPEQLCAPLLKHVERLTREAGGRGATCSAAPTAYGSVIVQIDARDGSTEAIKDALMGKTLIVRGARCVLALASASVRLPATIPPQTRPVVEKPQGSVIKNVSEDDWRRLQRLFKRRASMPGDKRAAWTRAIRAAGQAYADRPWAECRWHPPKREPLVIAGPSFFAAPKKPREAKEADAKADAKGSDSDADAKDVAAEAKGAEPFDERGAELRAQRRRRRLQDLQQPWRLDPRAPVDDAPVVDENVPPAMVAPPPPPQAQRLLVSSVFAAMRAVAALTPKHAEAPDLPTVAARLAARRREKGFRLSKRGELTVLDELARAIPTGGFALAEPACWGAAASNAVLARGKGPAARLRWLALARRAVAASWCFLSFDEFVQSHADAVDAQRRAARGALLSRVAQPESTAGPPRPIVDAINLATLPLPRRARPEPLPGGTFTWTTALILADAPADAPIAPILADAGTAPPKLDSSTDSSTDGPPRSGAEGKALLRAEAVLRGFGGSVAVSAIPQIVSVNVVGTTEEEVWRVVRSAFPDRSKTCLGRKAFVRDLWPALWGAFGGRWRSKP